MSFGSSIFGASPRSAIVGLVLLVYANALFGLLSRVLQQTTGVVGDAMESVLPQLVVTGNAEQSRRKVLNDYDDDDEYVYDDDRYDAQDDEESEDVVMDEEEPDEEEGQQQPEEEEDDQEELLKMIPKRPRKQNILIVVATCRKHVARRVGAIARTWANRTHIDRALGPYAPHVNISVWYFVGRPNITSSASSRQYRGTEAEPENLKQSAWLAGVTMGDSIQIMTNVEDDEYPPVRRNTAMISYVGRAIQAASNKKFNVGAAAAAFKTKQRARRGKSALQEEMATHDFVRQDNSTREFLANVQWVLKVDDDTYVNLWALVDFIQGILKLEQDHYVKQAASLIRRQRRRERTLGADIHAVEEKDQEPKLQPFVHYWGQRGLGTKADRPGIAASGYPGPFCMGGPGYLMDRNTWLQTAKQVPTCVNEADQSPQRKALWHSDVVIGTCVHAATPQNLTCWNEQLGGNQQVTFGRQYGKRTKEITADKWSSRFVFVQNRRTKNKNKQSSSYGKAPALFNTIVKNNVTLRVLEENVHHAVTIHPLKAGIAMRQQHFLCRQAVGEIGWALSRPRTVSPPPPPPPLGGRQQAQQGGGGRRPLH